MQARKRCRLHKMAYDWDPELLLGWRGREGGKKSDRELSLAAQNDSTIPCEAPVRIEFDDGESHELQDLTMGQVRANIMRVNGSATPLWEGEHVSTHHRIWAAQRIDRVLLLSTYEQGKQITQIRIDLFGELPEPQPNAVSPDHPAVVAAMKFMEPLLIDYQQDKLKDKHELKAARDASMKELGLCGRKKRPKERAAASSPKKASARKAAASSPKISKAAGKKAAATSPKKAAATSPKKATTPKEKTPTASSPKKAAAKKAAATSPKKEAATSPKKVGKTKKENTSAKARVTKNPTVTDKKPTAVLKQVDTSHLELCHHRMKEALKGFSSDTE